MTAPTQPRALRETRSFAPPSGPVVGFVDGDVVRVLGVPYAEAERFEAPRPATPAVDADGRAVPYEAFGGSWGLAVQFSRCLE